MMTYFFGSIFQRGCGGRCRAFIKQVGTLTKRVKKSQAEMHKRAPHFPCNLNLCCAFAFSTLCIPSILINKVTWHGWFIFSTKCVRGRNAEGTIMLFYINFTSTILQLDFKAGNPEYILDSQLSNYYHHLI